jgi:hypothetical protein
MNKQTLRPFFLLLLLGWLPQNAAAVDRYFYGNTDVLWGTCSNWDGFFCLPTGNASLNIHIAKYNDIFGAYASPTDSQNNLSNVQVQNLFFDASLTADHEMVGAGIRVYNGIFNQDDHNMTVYTPIEIGDSAASLQSTAGGQLWIGGNIKDFDSDYTLNRSTLTVSGNVKLSGDNRYGDTYIENNSVLEIAKREAFGTFGWIVSGDPNNINSLYDQVGNANYYFDLSTRNRIWPVRFLRRD